MPCIWCVMPANVTDWVVFKFELSPWRVFKCCCYPPYDIYKWLIPFEYLLFVHSVRIFNIMNYIVLVFIVVTNFDQTSILRRLFLHDTQHPICWEVAYWVKCTRNYSVNGIGNCILISLHFTLYFPVLFVKKCLFIRIIYCSRLQTVTLCYPSALILAHSIPLHHTLPSFTYIFLYFCILYYFDILCKISSVHAFVCCYCLWYPYPTYCFVSFSFPPSNVAWNISFGICADLQNSAFPANKRMLVFSSA
jgi:hypothetical protein